MMAEMLLEREQWLGAEPERVFAFFADARNLQTITPPWLHFQILPPTPAPLHQGALLRYRLRWHGLQIHWLTEISDWQPPIGFVDEQRRGPYARWHHTHRFVADGTGTRMFDTVRYRLPFGVIGTLAHLLIVRRDLEAIFDYRAKVADRIFKASPED